MNLATAMEIFTNPYDLEFVVGENPEKLGSWGLAITRGPEHRGKLMLTGEDFGSKEDAINTIIDVLNVVYSKGCEVMLHKPKDEVDALLKSVGNPNDYPVEKLMNMLIPCMIDQIKKDLFAKDICSTCTWLVLLQKENTFAIALTGWENVFEQAEGKEKAIEMIQRNIPRITSEVSVKFIQKVNEYYVAA